MSGQTNFFCICRHDTIVSTGAASHWTCLWTADSVELLTSGCGWLASATDHAVTIAFIVNHCLLLFAILLLHIQKGWWFQ